MPRGGFVLPWTGPTPQRIWTLQRHRTEAEPPALPFAPVHHLNAFLEDPIHDWVYAPRIASIRYYARVSTGGHWLLTY